MEVLQLRFLGFHSGCTEGELFSLLDGDNLENMEGVSLQAVTLADGSTAYIQHNSKGRQSTANWWLLQWNSPF